MVLGVGALIGNLRPEGRAVMTGISTLIKETPRELSNSYHGRIE
jgi:hypothetical protein